MIGSAIANLSDIAKKEGNQLVTGRGWSAFMLEGRLFSIHVSKMTASLAMDGVFVESRERVSEKHVEKINKQRENLINITDEYLEQIHSQEYKIAQKVNRGLGVLYGFTSATIFLYLDAVFDLWLVDWLLVAGASAPWYHSLRWYDGSMDIPGMVMSFFMVSMLVIFAIFARKYTAFIWLSIVGLVFDIAYGFFIFFALGFEEPLLLIGPIYKLFTIFLLVRLAINKVKQAKLQA